MWFFITVSIGGLWDFTTLSMYAIKIRLFRKYIKTQPLVYKRVSSILYKIFILTLFYEMVIVFWTILGVLQFIGDVFRSQLVLFASYFASDFIICSVSYSMYLMMDHNQQQYIKFLRVIYG